MKALLKFFTLVLLATSLHTSPQPELPPEIDPAAFEELLRDPAIQNELLEQSVTAILGIFDRCEYIIEHVAQIIATDKKGRYHKQEALPSMRRVKNGIRDIRELRFDHINAAVVKELNDCCTTVIGYLAIVFDSQLKVFPPVELAIDKIINNPTHRAGQVDFMTLMQEVEENQLYIDMLYQEADNVGLSWLNRTFRKLEVLDNSLNISAIARRSWPYLALGVWLVLLTDREAIEGMSLGRFTPLLEPIKAFKRFIGGLPFESKQTKRQSAIAENAPKQKSSDNAQPTFTEISPNYTSSEVAVINPSHGALGSPLYYLYGLARFTAEPLVQLSVPAMLLPRFKRDVDDLRNWLAKKWNRAQNNLRGSHVHAYDAGDIKRPLVTFNDLVGLDDAKEILADVVRYICDPERYDRSGTAIEKGFLLEGPTRTGKTFIAEALAGEINSALFELGQGDRCGFKEIKWWDLMQKDGIKAVIEDAKQDAPCVLFLDELDLLRLKREGDTVTLSEFLTGMSGLNRDDKKRVILIAATNRIEHLDQALLQHGRFGTIIHFENPRFADRRNFFEKSFAKLTLDLDEFDLDLLARETDGASFGDLEAIVRFAQFKAKTSGQRLSQKHMHYAIDHKTKHIMHSNAQELTEDERRTLAAYQAAQALAYLLLEPSRQLCSVTICPISKVREKPLFMDQFEDNKKKMNKHSIKYGKVFTYQPHETLHLKTEAETIKQIQIDCAGHVGEEIILGSRSHSYRKKDKQRALDSAKEIVFGGMKEDTTNNAKAVRQQLLQDAYELVQTCEDNIRTLLNDHKDELMVLVDALLEHETLTIDQMKALVTIEK